MQEMNYQRTFVFLLQTSTKQNVTNMVAKISFKTNISNVTLMHLALVYSHIWRWFILSVHIMKKEEIDAHKQVTCSTAETLSTVS